MSYFQSETIYVDKNYPQIGDYIRAYDVNCKSDTILQERNYREVHLVTNDCPEIIKPFVLKKYFNYRINRFSLKRIRKCGFQLHTALGAYNVEKRVNLNRENPITPIIYGVRMVKSFFINKYSLQFQEYLENYDEYITILNNTNSIKTKIKSLENVASLISKVHERNVFLIDINLRNILVRNETYKVIDLDAAVTLRFPFTVFKFIYKTFDLNCLGHFLKKTGHQNLSIPLFLKYAKVNNWSKRKTRLFYLLLNKSFFKI